MFYLLLKVLNLEITFSDAGRELEQSKWRRKMDRRDFEKEIPMSRKDMESE